MFWTLTVEPDMQWATYEYYLCVMSVCGLNERIPQNFIFNLVSRVIWNGIHWCRTHGHSLTQMGIIMASAARPSAWKVMRIAREYKVPVYASQSIERWLRCRSWICRCACLIVKCHQIHFAINFLEFCKFAGLRLLLVGPFLIFDWGRK